MKKCKDRGTCLRIGSLDTYHCITGIMYKNKITEPVFVSAAYYITHETTLPFDPLETIVHKRLSLISKYIISNLPKPGENYYKDSFRIYQIDMDEYMRTLNKLLNDKEVVVLPEKEEIDQFLNLLKEIKND